MDVLKSQGDPEVETPLVEPGLEDLPIPPDPGMEPDEVEVPEEEDDGIDTPDKEEG